MTPITEREAKLVYDLLRNSAARKETRQFVVEGPHILSAVLERAPADLRLAAFTEDAALRYPDLYVRSQTTGAELRNLHAKASRKLSDTEQPQGIFAIIDYPATRSISGNVILALDGIQDPGNVGTIMRTAAWFGCQTILFGDKTADAFSPKVVRSAQGATWSVNVIRTSLATKLPELKQKGYQLIGSSLGEHAVSLYDSTRFEKSVLILGSEAHGIDQALTKLCDRLVVIPKLGEGESLNVAVSAGILIAEISKGSKMPSR